MDTTDQDDSYARAIKVDPQARPLVAKPANNARFGRSFIHEPEIGACEQQHQDRLDSLDRKAGVK